LAFPSVQNTILISLKQKEDQLKTFQVSAFTLIAMIIIAACSKSNFNTAGDTSAAGLKTGTPDPSNFYSLCNEELIAKNF